MLEYFLTVGAAQAMQQLACIQGEVSRACGGQQPLLRNEEREQKRGGRIGDKKEEKQQGKGPQARGKEVEEKEDKEKEDKGEAQNQKKFVEKVQRKDRTFLHGEDERGKERKKKRKEKQTSKKMALLLLRLGQNWLGDNAAAEGLQRRTEMMERMQQQEVQVKESSWMEETPQRWRQPRRGVRTEMRKEEKSLKCTLLNGSAWSTEKKYMRTNKGTFDIFFGIEHRLRKDEIEEQFYKETMEGWWFAAEDQKHTSGGVFVAVGSNLGAVVGKKEGTVMSIPGNEGRSAKVWVNVRGGMLMSAAYFWHTDGWSPRNEAILEAVLKRARTTKHPWLMTCDANMSARRISRKPLVSERSKACDSTRGSVNVQIKKCQRRMGRESL